MLYNQRAISYPPNIGDPIKTAKVTITPKKIPIIINRFLLDGKFMFFKKIFLVKK